MHFHLRDHFHFHALHLDKEETAHLLSVLLGLAFTALLAACALYLALNIHDYYG